MLLKHLDRELYTWARLGIQEETREIYTDRKISDPVSLSRKKQKSDSYRKVKHVQQLSLFTK